MTKRRTQRWDPMESVIESALQPGRYIGWNEGFSFVSGLSHMEGQIKEIMNSDPARAAALYETFIAGCNLKAEETDDSDGELGTFASGLFCGWIRARQAADADRGETAKLLLTWMDHDDYGFCNDLDRSAVKVLDRAGLEAFEREVQVRFEAACAAAGKRGGPRSQLRLRSVGPDSQSGLLGATQHTEVSRSDRTDRAQAGRLRGYCLDVPVEAQT
jgi:hypothetical protein